MAYTRKDVLDGALQLVKEGVFTIDERGQIWRHKKWIHGRYLDLTQPRITGSRNRSGAIVLHVMLHGKHHTIYAHLLVYRHLLGDIPEGKRVQHADKNLHNNHPDNLELR